MAAPTFVAGKLVNAQIADFGGMRVEATYLAPVAGADGPARASVAAEPGGSFRLDLPGAGAWKGPLDLVVTGAAGVVLGQLTGLKTEDPALGALDIAVAADAPPTDVTPSSDPALGAIARFTGRVIDARGEPQRAGLLVVLWGLAPGAALARPVAVADTVAGGYFAGEWPSDTLTQAFARVAGSDPVAVPLEGGRLPRRIVLVIDHLPETDPTGADPPRAPSAEELAQQSEAFADDSGCCQSFTTPNRTVEEVTFQAVVRTTQPQIQGGGVRPQHAVPASILNRIMALTKLQPLMLDALTDPAPTTDTVNAATIRAAAPALRDNLAAAARTADDGLRQGVALMRSASNATLAAAVQLQRSGGPFDIVERARLILDTRDAQSQPLKLEPSVLVELAREPGGVSPARLLAAERTSMVRNFRYQLGALDPKPLGRFDLSVDHQADWDAPPLAYQASTIAHGHLLTMKQVWRADGYSLGDVLYSLPLAPGQQKLVSILDWERREATQRTEHRVTTEDLSASLAHDRDVSDIVRTRAARADGRHLARRHFGGRCGHRRLHRAGGVQARPGGTSDRRFECAAGIGARHRRLGAQSGPRPHAAIGLVGARAAGHRGAGRRAKASRCRAQTEAIANNNHCHALTIEYFEVLRHFQVSQELAQVQECLFVPFAITPFNEQKALRWRQVLQGMTIYYGGSVMELRAELRCARAHERQLDARRLPRRRAMPTTCCAT